MGWFVDMLMGGARPPKWKYIGHVPVPITVTRKLDNKGHDIVVKILFFMTDDGKRKIEIGSDRSDVQNWLEQYNDRYQNAFAWSKGSGFPKEFVPETDVLGQMLDRLVNMELTGENNG